jgi:hypothetical protein
VGASKPHKGCRLLQLPEPPCWHERWAAGERIWRWLGQLTCGLGEVGGRGRYHRPLVIHGQRAVRSEGEGAVASANVVTIARNRPGFAWSTSPLASPRHRYWGPAAIAWLHSHRGLWPNSTRITRWPSHLTTPRPASEDIEHSISATMPPGQGRGSLNDQGRHICALARALIVA